MVSFPWHKYVSNAANLKGPHFLRRSGVYGGRLPGGVMLTLVGLWSSVYFMTAAVVHLDESAV